MDYSKPKKPRRRVKPGELSPADILSGETLYLVGADAFFTDNTMVPTQAGVIYERGRPINRAVCQAIAASTDKLRDQLAAWRTTDVESLFKTLMEIDGIGQQTAILLCIAIRNEMPPIKYIIASDIHKAIFVEGPEKGLYGAASRGDGISTLIPIETAISCAHVLARRTIEELSKKFRNMPTVDEVVTLAGKGTTCLTNYRNKKLVIDTKLYEAEQHALELASTEVTPITDHFSTDDICDEQSDFIGRFLTSDKKLFLLQGGPGSGKTHVIKKLYEIYSALKFPVLITSYTNKACANLAERLPLYSFKPLGYNTVRSIYSISAKLGYSDQSIRNTRLIIVDESSMVSSFVLSKVIDILVECHPDCKLLLVGDINQLPPVNQYGKPFKRLWDLGVADCYEFHEFHRSDSFDIYSAFSKMATPGFHQISAGRSVNLATVRDIEAAASIVSRVYEREKEHINDLGCCTELKRQAHAINKACIARLFPDLRESEYIKYTARGEEYINTPAVKGLRVMATVTIPGTGTSSRPVGKNEIGTVVAVTDKTVTVTMDIQDYAVNVDLAMFPNQFKPAYATTVHKFQGSEADLIMYVMTDTSRGQADPFSTQKELKYVGMSRAKKTLNILSIDPDCPSRCMAQDALGVTAARSAEAKMSI